MKIKNIVSDYGNDFYYHAECEHCGHVSEKIAGYHDANYHQRVIPQMKCKQCGKDRAGNTGEPIDISPVSA